MEFPFAPLEAHARASGCTDVLEVAEYLGVTACTVRRWRRRPLTDRQADHAAVRLGLHPGTIWPQWWDEADATAAALRAEAARVDREQRRRDTYRRSNHKKRSVAA